MVGACKCSPRRPLLPTFLGDGRAHAARRHGARGGACRCDVVYVGMGTSAVCSTDGSDGLHTTVRGGRAVVRFIGLGLTRAGAFPL